MDSFNVRSLGVITTPFTQKLGIPRQPGLAPSAYGVIKLHKDFAREDTLRELKSFSHLWLMFWCHQSDSWRETIRPPRLGGKEKVGFIATRSPHRPNPIGLSVVKLESVDKDFNIHVSGVDILDQSPIIDIKPYIPMWDSLPEANSGWIEKTPELKPVKVIWSEGVRASLSLEHIQIIEETLRWNPRPSYEKNLDRSFIHTVSGVEVTWSFDGEKVSIESTTQKV